ncbi:hypothetical protein [Halovenus sp. HT40]|uniref:hypothetical protein n=1 Tax=Halovenus sp. HT40 TaxID=3126691 RepID=UPI00300F7ABC
MDIPAKITPASNNQIVFVVLVWAGIATGSTYLLQSPLVRWEIILGTAVVLIWTVWAIQHQLEQVRQDQYRQNL